MPFLYKQTKARHQNNPAHHRHGQTFCFQGSIFILTNWFKGGHAVIGAFLIYICYMIPVMKIRPRCV
ncbi:hypothetical protein CWD84_09895 [Bacillus siamensis]|uniref:Uncharacterized protein n=1 Tax=Bacillus siamensis TaxID=659243 RepID=A0AAI8N011_9BACI|nr:hypothetical protein CWD84_09895 [Bacillus siamensis]